MVYHTVLWHAGIILVIISNRTYRTNIFTILFHHPEAKTFIFRLLIYLAWPNDRRCSQSSICRRRSRNIHTHTYLACLPNISAALAATARVSIAVVAATKQQVVVHQHLTSHTRTMATPSLTAPAGVTPELTTLTPTPPPDTRSVSPGLSQQRYCLKWNNYQSNVTTTFKELLAVEDFVDITLMAEGGALRAHKVVLSACSPYFRDILKVWFLPSLHQTA